MTAECLCGRQERHLPTTACHVVVFDDDPIWEATVRGELDPPPDEADYYDGDDW